MLAAGYTSLSADISQTWKYDFFFICPSKQVETFLFQDTFKRLLHVTHWTLVACVGVIHSLRRMFVVYVRSTSCWETLRSTKPQWEQSTVLFTSCICVSTCNKGVNCVLPGGTHVPFCTLPTQNNCEEICETAGLSKWPRYLILDSQSRPRLFTQPALRQWPSIRSRKVSEVCLPRKSIGWAGGK